MAAKLSLNAALCVIGLAAGYVPDAVLAVSDTSKIVSEQPHTPIIKTGLGDASPEVEGEQADPGERATAEASSRKGTSVQGRKTGKRGFLARIWKPLLASVVFQGTSMAAIPDLTEDQVLWGAALTRAQAARTVVVFLTSAVALALFGHVILETGRTLLNRIKPGDEKKKEGTSRL